MISFNQLGNLGRLGNQMFQYASLRGIAANRGFDFFIAPESVFGVNDPNVKNSDTNIYATFNLSKYNKFREPILYERIEESGYHFDENIFNNCPDNVDLYGYFQSEKYFNHIQDEIKKDFSFVPEIVNECKKFIKELINDEVISLHIRRGDYLNLQDFHPTLSIEYYEKALDKLPNVPVIIFSDDIEWASNQQLFDSDRFYISESNTTDFDMCLMTMCDYHIIANSSFSWWGAWLSQSKKVIAPKNWFGTSLSQHKTSDLYCNGWEII
jgi:hypothetical protein